MAEVKITKRMRFEELKGIVKDNEELVKFLDHEIELLDNKKSKSGVTKTQKENTEIKEKIATVLAEIGRAVTITELQGESGIMAQYSNQKLSALLKQMVENGTVKKSVDKKKSYFAIAE